ncbi:uncharacterized protein [Scyliorhinus torazame]|uniref:uncharacterized protein n=1 Tax=Scyliorhinus torazame TaxID=75743 RepID=UPI003B595489
MSAQVAEEEAKGGGAAESDGDSHEFTSAPEQTSKTAFTNDDIQNQCHKHKKRLRSDNGATQNRFPQSNGTGGKGVHIIIRLISKAAESRSDINLALLSYRETPLSSGLSPAQMLFGRNIRTTLPAKQFRDPGNAPVLDDMRALCSKQKLYYDQHAIPLKPLTIGDTIRIRDPGGGWSESATVIRQEAPQSYIVKSSAGVLFRRNRQDLFEIRPTVPVFPTLDLTESISPQDVGQHGGHYNYFLKSQWPTCISWPPLLKPRSIGRISEDRSKMSGFQRTSETEITTTTDLQHKVYVSISNRSVNK